MSAIAALRTRLELSATRQRAAEERANAITRDLATLNQANCLIESSRSHADFAEWAKAENDLDRAAALRPDQSSIWLARGDLCRRLGLWDLAAEEFRRASRLHERGQSGRSTSTPCCGTSWATKPATAAADSARPYHDRSAYTLLLEIDPGAGSIYALRGVACAVLKQWFGPAFWRWSRPSAGRARAGNG